MRPAGGVVRGKKTMPPKRQDWPNQPQAQKYGRRDEESGRSPRSYNSEYFESNDTRREFIYKVYLILSVSLAFCGLLVFLLTYYEEANEFCIDHWYLSIVFSLAFLVVYIIFVCVESARKTFPINLILFMLMVSFLGLSAAIFACYFELIIICYAFFTTCALSVLITIIARFIPVDFTKCGTLLCIVSMVFMLVVIAIITICLFTSLPYVHVILAGLGVVLVVFFMLFDTQRILGGMYELEEDEYLLGAIQLYVDIIFLFKYLLILFAACDDE